jgi:hypothetical protein
MAFASVMREPELGDKIRSLAKRHPTPAMAAIKGYGDVATKKPGERLECVAYICNLAAGASNCFLPVSDAA